MRRPSWKWPARNCTPMGSPLEVKPQGTEIPGIPARFAEIVKMSERYICMGSSVFSPILKAGVGVVGVRMQSQSVKARSKSRLISARTWEAFL